LSCNEFTWTILPAVAEFEETVPLGNGRSHRRQFGESLSPEREPVHVLEALKLQIGSDAFSARALNVLTAILAITFTIADIIVEKR
jgi:hypothetical protein